MSVVDASVLLLVLFRRLLFDQLSVAGLAYRIVADGLVVAERLAVAGDFARAVVTEYAI